jgi:hypothetical protein
MIESKIIEWAVLVVRVEEKYIFCGTKHGGRSKLKFLVNTKTNYK